MHGGKQMLVCSRTVHSSTVVQHMKIYLRIIFLFTSALVFGQNSIAIAGKVISEEGNISNATVRIGTQGGITNDKGDFRFDYNSTSIPDRLVIDVSALGYRTRQFEYPSKEANLEDLIIVLSLFPAIDDRTALEDINNGNIQFLLSGGIAPVVYKSDKKFGRKYGVSFYEFGCEVVAEESLVRYNSVIAEYLDKKYGKKWRKKVRDDIVGIN